MRLAKKGLRETTVVNNSFTEWSGFERIEQNEKYIFVFCNAMVAHTIPKRAFEDEKQSTEFYSALKEYFEKSRANNNAA